ncbi:precorrin-2 C20-methyltransferase [Acetonema longum DSM 6540]|uniref:Precorrin-2 C20-methyltransferase n=1 Tax=Acetonema longum DSM 6540 TaxID=1009370 RepID=F7NPS6_9FIRM|nr:precorrin-2 C20-methyltransferase [Acetonema longum DSM 6540]
MCSLPRKRKKRESLAFSIVKRHIQPHTQVVDMVFPMIKDTQALGGSWADNKKKILEFLQEGKKVVFITLGDPMLYSTYIYVFKLLQDLGHQVVNIPGIPAFCAITSHTGFPIAEWTDVVAIVPATAAPDKIEKVLDICDAAVLMKVYKNSSQIIGMLQEKGFAANAVLASDVGTEREMIVRNISEAKDQPCSYLSTIVARRAAQNR